MVVDTVHGNRPAAGEERFAGLFHQYKNLVFKTAFLLLSDYQEAEDALQEVFLRVYKALPTFDLERGAFTTWLYRITVNYCLDRRRRHRPVILPLDKVRSLAGADPPRFAEKAENADAVLQAVERLSDKLRTVLVLRYYLDLPYKEIAEVLELPEGTVKSRLDLALKTLRRVLESDNRLLVEEEADR